MQRFMSQMKEQDKMPEKQWNEVKIDNIPEKEFRIMIVKMILDLGGGGNGEDANNVYQILRRTTEHTEMRNILKGINSRIIEVEELITD